MAADVGGLVGDIGLNVAGLRKDINKANRELGKGTNKMNRHLGGMRKRVEGIGTAFKGLAIGAGLVMLSGKIRTVVSDVNDIAKSSKSAAIEAEKLQELRFAFGRTTNASIKQIDDSLLKFTRRMGLASEGTGAAKDSFGDLNVSLWDMEGNLRTSNSVLEETLVALGKIENDSLRSAKASEVFGDRVGPKLAVALKGGTKELDTLRKHARDTGFVLSNDLVRGAEDAEDKLSDLSLLMDRNLQKTVLANKDGIILLADAFGTLQNAIVGSFAWLAKAGNEIGKLIHGSTLTPDQRLDLLPPKERLEGRIDRVKGKMQGLLRNLDRLGGKDVEGKIGVALKAKLAELKDLEAKLASLSAKTPSTESGGSGGGGEGPGKNLANLNQLMLEKAKLLEMIKTPQDRYNEQVKTLNELLAANLITDGEFNKGMEIAAQRLDTLKNKTNELGFTFSSAFEDAILDGERLSDVLKGLAKDIARIMIRKSITEPIGNYIGGLFGSFGGGKAAGGPVSPNKYYEVGENGPEIFVPDSSGTIIPNHQLGGGGGSVSVTINQDNRNVTPEFMPLLVEWKKQTQKEVYQVVSQAMTRGGSVA